MNLLILIITWYAFQIIYNYFFIKGGFNNFKSPVILSLYYFISILVLLVIFSIQSLNQILLFVVVISSLLLLYPSKKTKIVGARINNSLFQMGFIYIIFVLYGPLMILLVFPMLHLPIFILKTITFRGQLLIIVLSLLCSAIYTLLYSYFNAEIAFISTVMIHTVGYLLLGRYDSKYKLQMLN